jgi:hypothetical protein
MQIVVRLYAPHPLVRSAGKCFTDAEQAVLDPDLLRPCRQVIEHPSQTFRTVDRDFRSVETECPNGQRSEARIQAERGGLPPLRQIAIDPKRHAPRIPLFTREFREGLSTVADHVTRDALATAGALAATDPGAWPSVKHVWSLKDMLSCRLGRHRALFRLVGDDEIESCRLIHRRDLETTLKKMG